MRIQVAEVDPYGAPTLIAIVPSEFTMPGPGDQLLSQVQRHYPTHPIMLVSVEKNGFRAHATFQTHLLLALIQLEYLDLKELDLSLPIEENSELPF